jgi:hypothetical protein
MSTRLATRMSLRYLTAALVGGLALSLAPTAPVHADEPGYHQPRARTYVPRVRYAPRVRTVVRTRTVYVPQPVYYGGCAPAPQPVVYRPVYRPVVYQPVVYRPAYYAPRYYAAGCGGCVQSVAAPYYWAARYARYRYGYGYGAY